MSRCYDNALTSPASVSRPTVPAWHAARAQGTFIDCSWMFLAIFGCTRFSCTLLLLSALGCTSLRNTSLPHQAEQLIQEERYDQAIDTYRKHIEARLAASERPDWENPHFYLLQIADLQLKTSRPHEALQSCIEAEKQGVESSLLADRYRAIATWHVEHGDLQAAFEILKRYRDRDPLLFDSMLDRVGRALTAEDSHARRQAQDTSKAK